MRTLGRASASTTGRRHPLPRRRALLAPSRAHQRTHAARIGGISGFGDPVDQGSVCSEVVLSAGLVVPVEVLVASVVCATVVTAVEG